MKKLMGIIFALIITFTLTSPAFAEEAETDSLVGEQLKASGADSLAGKLPDEGAKLLDELSLDDISPASILSLNLKDFISLIGKVFKNELKKPLFAVASVFGMLILCGILEAMKLSFAEKSMSMVFSTVVTLAMSMVIVLPIIDCVKRTASLIDEVARFELSFVPIFSSIVAASGQITSAGVYSVIVFSVSQLITQLATQVILPVVLAYMGFCLVANLNPSLNLNGAAELMKNTAVWGLVLSVTVFSAILGVQGFVSSGADNVTLKTTKFLIGSSIPFVGGAISEAVGSVLGCLSLVKSTVGAFGIIAILVTVLPGFLRIILWMLALRLCLLGAEVLSVEHVSGVFKAVRSVLTVMLALLSAVSLMLIISTGSILLIST